MNAQGTLHPPARSPVAAGLDHASEHWKLVAARSTLGANLRATAWLLGRWFTTYRQIFLLVSAANLLLLCLSDLGWIGWRPQAVTLSTANLFLCVLFRNELFIRVAHVALVGSCNPVIVPLALRLRITSCLLHIGGFHRGFAVSGIVWLGVDLFGPASSAGPAGALLHQLGHALLGLTLIMCLLAIRPIREAHHNLFELSHRYLGWAGIAVLWCLVLLREADAATGRLAPMSRLLAAPCFWFTLGLTITVFLPWLTVRKARVKTYSPSQGVIAIKFPGGLGVGAFGRISRTLLGDWHTFALVPHATQAKSHLMIVSAVGDFTRGLVEKPPLTLFVRPIKFLGLPYSLQSYKRAVIVATGAGIAPFLPLLTHEAHRNYHVIWIGRSFQTTFGRRLSDLVFQCPHLTTWDTAARGRPNTLELVASAYRHFDAEVVFIGCNPIATRELVYGCCALGIPAFGPSWDS
ncbi:MAG TPA: hypothetical protein VNU71_01120 [Burkholderiaceae bacterium]|nr:hypothetical protein [Burkholderiaceae bacterium]